MSYDGPSSASLTSRPKASLVGAFAGLAILWVLSFAIIGATVWQVAATSQKHAADLQTELEHMQLQLGLINAEHDAVKPPSTAASVKQAKSSDIGAVSSRAPFTLTPSERESGFAALLGRVATVKTATTNGWLATVRPGDYLDGSVGRAAAAARGRVFNGSYFVAEASITVTATVLRDASVTLSRGSGTPESVSTADFVRRLTSRQLNSSQTWFWLKLDPDRNVVGLWQLR